MKKKQVLGLFFAALIFVGVGCASVFSHKVSENLFSDVVSEVMDTAESFNFPESDYIAIVDVTGTIQGQTETGLFAAAEGYQHTTTMNYIDDLVKDRNNKGILLYVDSPGGTVYESEELYDKLTMYSNVTERPIWAYMAHTAASGGYMASVSSDCIYANPNTVTGSIGVIMRGYDLSGLYDKLGIRYVSITSGEYKDSSQMTEEQMEIFQSQVDECYESFVAKVAAGRDMTTEDVKVLADGRTYTAKQALEKGLIDKISSYDDMKREMRKTLGVDEFYSLPTEENVFLSFFSQLGNILPKSESQVLVETADQMESGVLLYYAEQ